MDEITKVILLEVMRREGGAVNHPADKGGPTYKGVTLRRAQVRWPGLTFDQLQRKSDNELLEFYWDEYVKKSGFHHVDDPKLRALLVDFAINSGPEDAIQALQVALEVDDLTNKQADLIGPRTLAAVRAHKDPRELYRRVFLFRWKKLDDLALRNRVTLEFIEACRERPGALATVLGLPPGAIQKCQLAFAAGWNARLRELLMP